ncbi:MAG TPA: hypothetical protein VGJ86_18775 [Acidimicrobiales bacterium]
MPDITSLLDFTTPRDVPPLDLNDLARRGRRRQQRHRRVVAGGTIAAVLIAVLVLSTLLSPGGSSKTQDPAVQVDDDPPRLVEPVGSWEHVADPPFGARIYTFGAKLGDGRIIVWGGIDLDAAAAADAAGTPRDWETDGAIYDPTTNTWEEIPPAPLQGLGSIRARMTDDRLAVVSTLPDGVTTEAAVFDVVEGQWHAAPTQVLPSPEPNFIWNGQVLALVYLEDQPATLRWRTGTESWQTGTPPPLSARTKSGGAFDGERLAVWGGVSGSTRRDDGAIYHLATDSWTLIPSEASLSGRDPKVTWFQGRLYVTPRTATSTEPIAMEYDTSSRTWTAITPPPQPRIPYPYMFEPRGYDPTGGLGHAQFLVGPPTASTGGPSELVPRAYLDSGDWEQAPYENLIKLDEWLTVAVAGTFSSPGPGPFDVKVRAGTNEWLDTAPSPILNRRGPTVVPLQDSLFIMGGAEEDPASRPADAWILHLRD